MFFFNETTPQDDDYFARILGMAGHTCVRAAKRVTRPPDLVIMEGASADRIRALMKRVRSAAGVYVPAMLAAGSKKTIPPELRDVVDDVIEDSARPTLVKLKVEGLLRMKRRLDRLAGDNARLKSRLRRSSNGVKRSFVEIRASQVRFLNSDGLLEDLGEEATEPSDLVPFEESAPAAATNKPVTESNEVAADSVPENESPFSLVSNEHEEL